VPHVHHHPDSSKRHIPIPLRDSVDVVWHPLHDGTRNQIARADLSLYQSWRVPVVSDLGVRLRPSYFFLHDDVRKGLADMFGGLNVFGRCNCATT
jgi:hypothetical protein